MKNYKYYTYFILHKYGDFIGYCLEFPSLSWGANTPNKAFNGIQKLVKDILKDMKKNKEEIPNPKYKR